MSSSLKNEDEFDIYGDLPSFDLGASVSKLEAEKEELNRKVEQLIKDLSVQNSNNEELRKTNKSLNINISCLYKTAQSEIQRKDATIADLRRELDNLVFRRGGRREGNVTSNIINSGQNYTDSLESANHGRKEDSLKNKSIAEEKIPKIEEVTKKTEKHGSKDDYMSGTDKRSEQRSGDYKTKNSSQDSKVSCITINELHNDKPTSVSSMMSSVSTDRDRRVHRLTEKEERRRSGSSKERKEEKLHKNDRNAAHSTRDSASVPDLREKLRKISERNSKHLDLTEPVRSDKNKSTYSASATAPVAVSDRVHSEKTVLHSTIFSKSDNIRSEKRQVKSEYLKPPIVRRKVSPIKVNIKGLKKKIKLENSASSRLENFSSEVQSFKNDTNRRSSKEEKLEANSHLNRKSDLHTSLPLLDSPPKESENVVPPLSLDSSPKEPNQQLPLLPSEIPPKEPEEALPPLPLESPPKAVPPLPQGTPPKELLPPLPLDTPPKEPLPLLLQGTPSKESIQPLSQESPPREPEKALQLLIQETLPNESEKALPPLPFGSPLKEPNQQLPPLPLETPLKEPEKASPPLPLESPPKEALPPLPEETPPKEPLPLSPQETPPKEPLPPLPQDTPPKELLPPLPQDTPPKELVQPLSQETPPREPEKALQLLIQETLPKESEKALPPLPFGSPPKEPNQQLPPLPLETPPKEPEQPLLHPLENSVPKQAEAPAQNINLASNNGNSNTQPNIATSGSFNLHPEEKLVQRNGVIQNNSLSTSWDENSQCPFKSRRRIRAVKVISSLTEPKPAQVSNSVVSVLSTSAKNEIPKICKESKTKNEHVDSVPKKDHLNKEYMEEPKSLTEASSSSHSFVNKRNLFPPKSTTFYRERRSPSELLNGGRSGKIARVSHQNDVSDHDRSRSGSPKSKRMEEDYRRSKRMRDESDTVEDQSLLKRWKDSCRNSKVGNSKEQELSKPPHVAKGKARGKLKSDRKAINDALFGESSDSSSELENRKDGVPCSAPSKRKGSNLNNNNNDSAPNVACEVKLEIESQEQTDKRNVALANQTLDTKVAKLEPSNNVKCGQTSSGAVQQKQHEVIVIRRRSRPTVKLENSIGPLTCITGNTPIKKDDKVQKVAEKNTERKSLPSSQLQSTPLYFREQPGRAQDESSEEEGFSESEDQSSDSDASYHPKSKNRKKRHRNVKSSEVRNKR